MWAIASFNVVDTCGGDGCIALAPYTQTVRGYFGRWVRAVARANIDDTTAGFGARLASLEARSEAQAARTATLARTAAIRLYAQGCHSVQHRTVGRYILTYRSPALVHPLSLQVQGASRGPAWPRVASLGGDGAAAACHEEHHSPLHRPPHPAHCRALHRRLARTHGGEQGTEEGWRARAAHVDTRHPLALLPGLGVGGAGGQA